MSVEQVERHLISAKEASQWLGVPVTTLYGWAWTGRIPHYKVHKRVLFDRADLLRWLEKYHRPPCRASQAPEGARASEALFGERGPSTLVMREGCAGAESSFLGAC